MIRKANLSQLPQILSIYERARAFMAQTGNPTQWGDHFPPHDLLRSDIPKKQLYVVEHIITQLCGVAHTTVPHCAVAPTIVQP